MKCPFCPSPETKVVDKREIENEAVTRRRRECLKCEKRFTTYEHIEVVNLNVVKKDGRREKFDRNKLKSGILKACEKRPVSGEKVDQVVSDVEYELMGKEREEITTKALGELVMRRLRKLDKVAYIRFASVYRDFADITMFKSELDKLTPTKKEDQKEERKEEKEKEDKGVA
ncbi:MAG: transcriptional regulator NrdR [Candidatus Woesearchaeota archaeon]|nr:transcriptional regulator NrdR [Candidatus Woesearchaeota archaeon]